MFPMHPITLMFASIDLFYHEFYLWVMYVHLYLFSLSPLSLIAERIIDVILSATQNYGLGSELDRYESHV